MSKHSLFKVRSAILFGASMGLFLTLFFSPEVAAQATASSIWSIVKSANGGTPPVSNSVLQGLSALSDTDVWAVGHVDSNTLIEHWNGSAWKIVPSPSEGSRSALVSISADSSGDAWAVGQFFINNNNSATLIEHWNGSAWTIVSSPNGNNQNNQLSGVVSLSATNAWAVGFSNQLNSPQSVPLIEHWDGHSWSVVNIPITSSIVALHAITAVSANDIWAVGEQVDNQNNAINLEMHWNGQLWSIAPAAIFPNLGQTLTSVTAVSSTDVWAVGSFGPTNGEMFQPLALHWNGKQWSMVATPTINQFFNGFSGVAAISSTDVWAVGQTTNPNDFSPLTLIEHWNGQQWSIVKSPNRLPQGNNTNTLYAVVASGPQTLWASGYWDSEQKGNSGFRTLTEHTSQG